MTRQFFSVFCAFSVAVTVFAATGPKINFAEPVHDFGRMPYGTALTNFFVFTNTGDQSLEISEIISSCGCVAAQNWPRRVESGKTGVIPVIFKASGIGDNVTKPIRILCNDAIESNAVIYVQAQIYKPIDAVPPVAMFMFGPDFQTNETRIIQLVSNLSEPVTLSEPVCTNHSFAATLKTVTPGKEFELSVSVIPPLGAGSWFAPITMKSSSTNMPEVKVTAYAMVQPALTVMPVQLMLPHTPLAKDEQVLVRIQNNATNSLHLSEPSLTAPQGKLQLSEVQPGRLFELRGNFPAGFQTQPGKPLEVRIKSNSPQSPVIRIPIIELDPADAPEVGAQAPTTPANR